MDLINKVADMIPSLATQFNKDYRADQITLGEQQVRIAEANAQAQQRQSIPWGWIIFAVLALVMILLLFKR